MGLDALLENQHGHWPKFRSCTYTLFLSQGFEIELIFAMGGGFHDELLIPKPERTSWGRHGGFSDVRGVSSAAIELVICSGFSCGTASPLARRHACRYILDQ